MNYFLTQNIFSLENLKVCFSVFFPEKPSVSGIAILKWCQSAVATGLLRINDARRRFSDRSCDANAHRSCEMHTAGGATSYCPITEILTTWGARGFSRFSLSSRWIQNHTSASETTMAKCEHPSRVTNFMIRCIIALHERGISQHASSREFREFRGNARNDEFAGYLIRRGSNKHSSCRTFRREMKHTER